ncbi:DUF1837 domain-containing protein [Dyella sp. LX-66]|uniref:Hachiman antiphage defense system protein HamA n=1 Tax=unclassified Dyella TaxID=2634549 RepID=UPI001BDFAF20|nr:MULTISPECIES: Hachiman antiphage defense system protein HamA [unclassified Dyella]MBT2119567.1 DUF1837 domain-containing protein [Dyella sp. LX-1]MBT2141917.1 DUF1837 domain-containing protein [Dyella sp. LX-66]
MSESNVAGSSVSSAPMGALEHPKHLECLTKSKISLQTADGRLIEVWELDVPLSAELLSPWASRFRQQYCPDHEIDQLREGTGLSRADYLTQLVFPDKSNAPGPAIRSGDFAELLVSDYVEFVLGYQVPRGKYADKASRNESVKGVDILGFKMVNPPHVSLNDTLLAFEVKAKASGAPYSGQLQSAIDDSSEDYLRRAITLNATKRRLLRAGEGQEALVVQRFQNQADHPYIYRSGAAALLSDDAYNKVALEGSVTEKHQNSKNLELIVIRGSALMNLIHALYERAANEA